MSQLVIVVNVPEHNESEVVEYIGLAQELVRLVKLQHPHDDGISIAGVALGDEDTIHEHYWKP
jgi:hypothetical protein